MVALNISVVFIILLKSAFSQASINDIKLPVRQNPIDSVSECVSKLFIKEIPSNSIVFIVSTSNYHRSLLQYINTFYQFLIISRSFDAQQWLVYPDVYLISVNNCAEFLTGINKLSKDLSWNPSAKFFIIFKNIKENTIEILEVFNEMLRKNIINVVLITYSTNNDCELLTYYPYSGTNCGKNASDIRNLGDCRNLTDTPLFPDKIPNGLRNCTLLVAGRDATPYVIKDGDKSKYLNTGIEQYVFNIIAELEEFNYEIFFNDPKEGVGVIFPNGTITGILKYLQNDNVSIIIGGLFLLKNRVEVFDFIYGYNYGLFSIFTPVIPEQKWTRVYRPFGFLTWVLIIISFIFTTIIVLTTLTITSGRPKDKFMIILKLWRYFYGQVDDNLFRNNYLKIIMIIWILYTNSICAFYNTALYSLITGHVQGQIIVDPKNLASLPFKPCIKDQIINFFKISYNEIIPRGERSPRCRTSDATFETVGTRTNFYTIDTEYAYFLRGSKYQDAEGRLKIKKWDFQRNIVSSIFMKKGFPLRKKFQKRAMDFYERGFLKRHLSNLLLKKPKTVSALEREYSKIRLEDLIIYFIILMVGAVISFISFLIELRAR